MNTSSIEYMALTVSPLVNGEAKLVIADSALTLASTMDAAEIPFSEINALRLDDYTVTVRADSGDYVFSKLGQWCQPFFDALCEAYNKAVLRSLFVKGEPIVTAKGDYRYTEAGVNAGGAAPVYIYDNCVVVLPTNLGARRVPLCFTSGIEIGEFEITLRLDTGESYTWAKLGYDTAFFAENVESQMRALREKTLKAIKEIDPSVSAVQGSQLVKLIPQGAAASIGALAGVAPSFAKALEEKIADTRAAEGYTAFKEICDPAKIYIGFRKNEDFIQGVEGGAAATAATAAEGGAVIPEGLAAMMPDGTAATDGAAGEETEEQDPYLLWIIAPSPSEEFAAVEFAEPNSATFVYRTGGDFNGFAWQLSRALEAIDFKREVIRLSDEELLKPKNAIYYMAAKRTAALAFIRANFVGRVIHSSPEAWKRKLEEYWGS